METALQPKQVFEAINAKVRETLAIAEKTYGKKFKMPIIEYTLKGDTAGQAIYFKWSINLNLFYIVSEYEDMINDTIPHEIAHLVARSVYGRKIKPHGWQWQSVMRSFGLNPKRCHSYKEKDVRIAKRRKFIYNCDCSVPCEGGLNVHKKIQSGSGHLCRKCKKKLRDCSWFERKA